jgi:hypothetical protein
MTRSLLIALFCLPLGQPAKPAVPDAPAWQLALPGPGLDLLDLREVQRELKLTDDQKQLIADLKKDLDKERSAAGVQDFRAFLQLTPSERARYMERARAAAEAAARKADQLLAVILDPAQSERLRQLRLQRQGPEALGMPGTAGTLQLTESQRAAVRKLLAEPLAPAELPVESAKTDSEAAQKAELFKRSEEDWERAMREARQRRDTQLLRLLTDDQKQRWQTMLGKPFVFPASAASNW